MDPEIFVDTSGFYALLVSGEEAHAAAVEILERARQRRGRFVTTDYVLDEVATLLRARGQGHLTGDFLRTTLESRVCLIHWMDAELFERTVDHFLKFADKNWSFTDCSSFLVMEERGLREALTKDHHFVQAGFRALLH